MKLLLNPRGMSFDFTVGDWRPCEGVQKIAGFSRGWHHSNSIRLGYNRDTKTSPVRLFMYVYLRGKRIIQEIGKFYVGDKLKCDLCWEHKYKEVASLITDNNGCVAKLNIVPLNSVFTLPIGYKLGCYAEQDRTQKRLDFNVELTNVKYW